MSARPRPQPNPRPTPDPHGPKPGPAQPPRPGGPKTNGILSALMSPAADSVYAILAAVCAVVITADIVLTGSTWVDVAWAFGAAGLAVFFARSAWIGTLRSPR